MAHAMGYTSCGAAPREGSTMTQGAEDRRTYLADDGVAKVYFGKENLEWIRDEAARRGWLQGGRPNVSKMVIHMADFFRQHEAKPETLAALAISEPKATRDRIRAALVLAGGSYTKSAAQLNVAPTDFRRAVEALDMAEEIGRKYPKGAA